MADAGMGIIECGGALMTAGSDARVRRRVSMVSAIKNDSM